MNKMKKIVIALLLTVLFACGFQTASSSKVTKLEYKSGGYTEYELITSGRTGVRQADGSTYYEGFYIAPNGNYYPVDMNALKADGKCNPNYSVCVPNVDYDLDCGDISAKSFRVIGFDQYGFDGDGDGIACEPYYGY